MSRLVLLRSRIASAALLTGMGLNALAADALAPAHPATGSEPAVFAPNETYAGRSQGEWAASWWIWAFSIPDEVNPLRDPKGGLCAMGQQGGVWFLAGALSGGKVNRTCTVPAGKAIFLPLINTVFIGPGKCKGLEADAAATSDHLAYAHFELDGVALADLSRHRQKSPACFSIDPNGMATQDGSRQMAATDGYWVMLRPLSPGDHVLKFTAAFNKPDERFGQMKQDIVYRLHVLAQ